MFAAFSFSSVAGSSRKLKEEPHEYDADVKPQSVPTTSIGQSTRTDKRRKLLVKKELFDPGAIGGRRVSEVVNVKAEVDIEDIKGHIATQKDLKNESNETKVIRFHTKAEGEQKGRSPPHWEKIVEEIRSMRIDKDAPVDLFGTHQLLDVSADKETQRFHALVAAMISSQTRDAVTGAAMQRLHAMPGGLTITQVASDSVEVDALAEILKPVGFYSGL